MIATEWLWGLAGGLMIGTAAALYLLVNGRIMGASGILGGLVDGTGRGTATERLCFLAGCLHDTAIHQQIKCRGSADHQPARQAPEPFRRNHQ